AVVQRAGVDVALVAVAGLAWWQLRQYGQAVTPRNLGGLGVDPLLVAAPVLAVLAATAVALRLLPLATRLGVRLAGRRDAFSGLLGMWQADRRPHAGPVRLLVLAVATSVLAPTVAAAWQQSQKDQAAHAVGADLRLEGNDPRLDPQVRQLADMPQVDGLAAVHRTVTARPDGRRVPVLAIDSDRAAQVVRLRQDLAPDGAAALFGVLHEGRPQVAGIPLPEDARRLTGTLRYDAPDEQTVTDTFETPDGPMQFELVIPPVESRVVSVHLAGADGVVEEVELARPESGQPVTFDLPLPPGTASVVGLEAGVRAPNELGFVGNGGDQAVEVAWRWELAVVDGDGDRVPLEVPGTWSVRGVQPGGPAIHLAGDGAVRGVVDFRHAGAQVSFLVTEPVDADEVPALVTPGALSAIGAQ